MNQSELLKQLPQSERWLKEQSQWNFQTSVVAGRLWSWFLLRFVNLSSRRLISGVLHSLRYILCLFFVEWFNFGSLIYDFSLISILSGVALGFCEPLKQMTQRSEFRLRHHSFQNEVVRLRVVLQGFIVLTVLILMFPLLNRVVSFGTFLNVYEIIRIILVLKLISQIIRQFYLSIEASHGLSLIPFRWMLTSELFLTVVFYFLLKNFNEQTYLIPFLVLMEWIVLDVLSWWWLYKNKVHPIMLFFKFSFRRTVKCWRSTEGLLKLSSYTAFGFLGALLNSERMILLLLMGGLHLQGGIIYYIALPFLQMMWRFPLSLSRYLKYDQNSLMRAFSKELFKVLLGFQSILAAFMLLGYFVLMNHRSDLLIRDSFSENLYLVKIPFFLLSMPWVATFFIGFWNRNRVVASLCVYLIWIFSLGILSPLILKIVLFLILSVFILEGIVYYRQILSFFRFFMANSTLHWFRVTHKNLNTTLKDFAEVQESTLLSRTQRQFYLKAIPLTSSCFILGIPSLENARQVNRFLFLETLGQVHFETLDQFLLQYSKLSWLQKLKFEFFKTEPDLDFNSLRSSLRTQSEAKQFLEALKTTASQFYRSQYLGEIPFYLKSKRVKGSFLFFYKEKL